MSDAAHNKSDRPAFYEWLTLPHLNGEMKLSVPVQFCDHARLCHLSGASLHQFLAVLMVSLQRKEIELEDFDYWVRATLVAFPE